MQREGRGKMILFLLFLIWTQHPDPFPDSIYSDHRATSSNDIVTVLILEDMKASRVFSSSSLREKEKGRGIKGFFGLEKIRWMSRLIPLKASANYSSELNSSGSIDRSGRIMAVLSARVTDVLENGNLVIEGGKEITINGKKELLHLRGVVRPEDISFQNTVLSSSIADLEIRYEGEEDKGRKGFVGVITRILDWLWIF